MLQLRVRARVLLYALALLATGLPFSGNSSSAADDSQPGNTANNDILPLPPDEDQSTSSRIVRIDEALTGEPLAEEYSNGWAWQWLPTGLIYHSYMAGPHEPRMAIVPFANTDGGIFADGTLGGRVGFLQFGNGDPLHPEGFQLDFYGAAIARLDVENQEDLDSCDYVFGLPLTYGNEQWQWKLGYAHLSSHLGDEFAITNPGALNDRVNYVRDSLVWGTSIYPLPALRLYGEVGWAFHRDGGAGPWETQFGTELSRPGPTGPHLTPFLAINGRLRENQDIVGDLTIDAGWLRRGILGQTFRIGAHYYNGKSSQSQFFNNSEQQIGFGLWYDF